MERQTDEELMCECLALTLVDLMDTRPLSSISVSELTKQAGISRATFYRHFSSAEDVLERYIACIMHGYEREVVHGRGFASYIVPENIVLMAAYFRRHRKLVEVLLARHMGDFLRKPIVQGVLALSLRSEVDLHERALAVAYANSLFGLLAQWMEDGMKTAPEDIADTLCELYQSRMKRM
ncbi:MAG: TetR/AcrR family transcriptional regulator [Atopobiaceae bacterium]